MSSRARVLADYVGGGTTAAEFDYMDGVTSSVQDQLNAKQATVTTGISNTNHLVANANVADNDFLKVDGTSIEGRTAAETLSDIAALPLAGGTMSGTTSLQDSHLKILTNSADADDSNVWFQKSRHATDGSHTIVQDNDDLGSIIWDGSDGDSFETAAKIIGRIDGSPSAGSDMPGSLEFQTSGEGSASPTTRMTIASSGNVGVGTDAPSQLLEVEKDQNAATWIQLDNNTAGTAATAGLVIDADAASGQFRLFSSSFTTSGYNIQDSMLLLATSSCSGGLNIVNAHASSDISLWTNSAKRMKVTSGGNVGISSNTFGSDDLASPDVRLHTASDGSGGIAATSGTSAHTAGLRVGTEDTNAVLDFGANGSANNSWIQSRNRGNLATSYSYPLLLNPNGGNLIHSGADTYTASFYTSAQTVINFDITLGQYWQGMVLIQCCAGYYPGTAYTCSLYGWYAVRMGDVGLGLTTAISTTQNSTSNNHVGHWTVQKIVASPETDSTQIRITKERGGVANYGVGGNGSAGSSASLRGFVKVTYRGA